MSAKETLSLSLDHSIAISDLRQSSEISVRIFIGTFTFVAFFEIISAVGSALEYSGRAASFDIIVISKSSGVFPSEDAVSCTSSFTYLPLSSDISS